MNKMAFALVSAGLGAGIMYFVDPDRGRRRRARLGGALVQTGHRAQAVTALTARDVRHRLTGVVARTRDRVTVEPIPSDEVLVERVRARLGRLVSHPGAIHVDARAGAVTLTGRVFAAEVEQLLGGVAAVAGVTSVDSRVQAHRDAAHVPALQGPGPHRMPARAENWLRCTPTARLTAGAAGLALLGLSLAKRPFRRAVTWMWVVELLVWALLGDRKPMAAGLPAERRHAG